MKTLTKITIASAALALLGVSAVSVRGDNGNHRGSWKQIVIDVACDGRTFVLNPASPGGAGPMRGDTFIVNGKILPGGTIPSGNGFNFDGATNLLGAWVCRGTFNFNDNSVPGQSTTQYYLFSPTGSLVVDDSLVSEGPEGGVTTQRVVPGGTGKFLGMNGQVKQEMLGMNSTGFPNFRFTFTVRSPD